MLLKSDGRAAACGGNDNGESDIPVPGKGLTYTQVEVGGTPCY